MYNSIQQFNETGTKNLEKIFMEFAQDTTKFAEMIKGVTENVIQLGLNMIAEELEYYDELLRSEKHIRPDWYIVKRDKTSITTSLGTVCYHKTLFIHKQSKERVYLLDHIMNMHPHIRLSEDAVAKALQEAAESSYEKAGNTLCLSGEQISKETVMNKIHVLEFPKASIPPKKKVVPYLYIDADEDHVPLQYRNHREDLKCNKSIRKNNRMYSKLIYVYEGIEPETLNGKRNKLINPYYFARVCNESSNDALWDEVYEYLENHYELNKVKTIYLNADGGLWIKSGMERLENVTYVLDEFHLRKYITKLSSHMNALAGDTANKLCYLICHGTKKEFKTYIEYLKQYLTNDRNEERYDENAMYILNNWGAAKIRLQRKEGVLGSSTEGHVSHVLADRMSSRPMGWSVIGAAKMSELRAWFYNCGDMLELVRYQKKVLPKAVGIHSCMTVGARLNLAERRLEHQPSQFAGVKNGSLSMQVRKKLAILHTANNLFYV